jgi:hypothetical protein
LRRRGRVVAGPKLGKAARSVQEFATLGIRRVAPLILRRVLSFHPGECLLYHAKAPTCFWEPIESSVCHTASRCDAIRVRESFGLVLHYYFRTRFCSADRLSTYQRRLDDLTMSRFKALSSRLHFHGETVKHKPRGRRSSRAASASRVRGTNDRRGTEKANRHLRGSQSFDIGGGRALSAFETNLRQFEESRRPPLRQQAGRDQDGGLTTTVEV